MANPEVIDCAGRGVSRNGHGYAWLAVAAVLIAVHLILPRGLVADATYLVVVWGAAVAAWIGTRRADGTTKHVTRLIALGVTFATTGDSIFAVVPVERRRAGRLARRPPVAVRLCPPGGQPVPDPPPPRS